MLMAPDKLKQYYRCPRFHNKLIDAGDHFISESGVKYQKVNGQPILIDFEDSVFDQEDIISTSAKSPIERTVNSKVRSWIKKYALHGGADQLAKNNAEEFINEVKKRSKKPLVLIIGGGTKGIGTELFYDCNDIEVVSFDIYLTTLTQFVADAHKIPLMSNMFDGIWVQYVIEHLLDPWKAVKEIHRLLKPSSIIYCETPFMQQVHEANYDFVRFSHSGHRWLFRDFDEIRSGIAMGQGSQLLWTIENLARGIFRSRKSGQAVKILLFWLRYLEVLIPVSYRYDSASSFYFLGKKADVPMKAKDIAKYYRGALK